MNEKINKILNDARNCKPTDEEIAMIDYLIDHSENEIDEGALITTAFLAGRASAGVQLDLTSGD